MAQGKHRKAVLNENPLILTDYQSQTFMCEAGRRLVAVDSFSGAHQKA